MTFHQVKKLGGNINPNCFEFLPSENLVISVCGSVINLHNFSTGSLLKTYDYHHYPLISIAFLRANKKQELFSLDESGMIKCVDLKSESNAVTWGFHLRENIRDGFINKTLKKIYYTVKGHNSTVKVFNFFNNEISHINVNTVAESAESNSKYHGFRSSRDDRFGVHFESKNIILYDLQENKVLNQIVHDNLVSVVDLNLENTVLAVGDVIGKIYMYYDPLVKKEGGGIKSSKFHWHCRTVLTLKFNTISNVLLSGGYEVDIINLISLSN